MQSETSQPGSSAPDEEDLSQSNKRRRTSDRSIGSTQSQAESSSNAPTTARLAMTRSSPQRGSSREMTPPEGPESIRYTRTGRVSRANKGQRVHHCEECGKTYTRAEHLRRHQQNHKPGAYPCDIPGCNRSFYREDLLVRHKARHNDPLHPVSGQPSPSSQDSAPAAELGSRLLSLPTDTHILQSGSEPESIQSSAPRQSGRNGGQQDTSKRATYKGSPENIQHRPSVLVTTYVENPASLHTIGGGFLPWDPDSPSPTGWVSPPVNDLTGPPYYQSQSRRDRHSDASYFSYTLPPHASQSPISAGSSTVYPPYWGNNAHDATYRHLSTDFGAYHGPITDLHLFPEYRDLMEQAALVLPTRTPENASLDPNLDDSTFNETKYFSGYWMWVHPFFPIIHKPSFSPHNASPLLKAAMQALGAHALGGRTNMENAKFIHERCTKVLKKRTLDNSHTTRVCDFQAVVLVEIYSIFKSKRPPFQFSKSFEDVFEHLTIDNEALTVNHGVDAYLRGSTALPGSFADEFPDNSLFVLDAECKQRLLAACYILNHQHALLFGRKRSACFPGSGEDLPFPRSQNSWDSSNGQQRGSEEYVHEHIAAALAGGSFHQLEPYDVFQATLFMACVVEPADGVHVGTGRSSADLSAILALIEQSPRVNLAYNTFLLCKHTPVRKLLAVAGETWVMGEKLTSQAEYTEAQLDGLQWARGFTDSPDTGSNEFKLGRQQQSEIQRALTHALKILELHQTHPKTGLLFQEWSVYLASVVIWARAYATRKENGGAGPRLAVPEPREMRVSVSELEQAVSALVAKGVRVGREVEVDLDLDLEVARKVLLWTRGKIEKVDLPHYCGLTNGALDVLGKLVGRGSEEGWFGL